MVRKILQNLSQVFRKLSRLYLYFVLLFLTGFVSFLIIKVVVHWLVYIQRSWPPVWWIF